ncbi:MAG TPA: copper amine oxidase, partial [Planococcus sp. (in: firmicutes)]|nr:copper amine oxidase [Planococcus sp. (in: firmicutes)]
IYHMSMFAETLSIAIADQFPEEFDGTNPDTPAVDLRAQLNYVFTEHAGLAVMAMQDGADGAESFDQAAGALLANADDLTAAVSSVYGEEAGGQFDEIWKSHIGYFVDYVVATGEGNAEAQEQAKAELDEYIVEQAAFLDAATEGRVPADALEEGLTAHVDQLLTAFDSYVAGDYETAYASLRESYAHMTMPAAGLSAAIVDQFPEEFGGAEMPSEMPATGFGGAAGTSTLPYLWILAGLMLAGLTGTIALRTRKQS